MGPVLAAQFGYLPGTLWILAGAVFGGCVQDFVILLFSVRRDGKSLTEMASTKSAASADSSRYVAIISIIVVLLGVVLSDRGQRAEGEPVGNIHHRHDDSHRGADGDLSPAPAARKSSRNIVLGFVLVMLAIWGGQWASLNRRWRRCSR